MTQTPRAMTNEQPTRPRCDKCNELTINGTRCHENGCSNMGRVYDHERQQWVKYVECFYCGCDVEHCTYCGCDEQEDYTYDCDEEEEA